MKPFLCSVTAVTLWTSRNAFLVAMDCACFSSLLLVFLIFVLFSLFPPSLFLPFSLQEQLLTRIFSFCSLSFHSPLHSTCISILSYPNASLFPSLPDLPIALSQNVHPLPFFQPPPLTQSVLILGKYTGWGSIYTCCFWSWPSVWWLACHLWVNEQL